MEKLENVYMSPLPPDSPYVKTFRLNYTQNGHEKNWDLLEVHDSVAVIIFNKSRKVLVLVKQFRPAVYYSSVPKEDKSDGRIDTDRYPASLGISLELCAGIIDKNIPLIDIAREEILEECGYEVNNEDIKRIISYRSGVGVKGALQTLYYCEVTDDMKTTQGGGIGDEIIEVIEMSIAEIEKMLTSPGPLPSPPSFLFGLMWFLTNIAPKYKS